VWETHSAERKNPLLKHVSLSLSVSLHVCDCSLNHCVTIAPFIQQRLAHDRHVGPNVELHEWLKILKSQACILLQVCANRGYQTPLDSIVSVLSRFCLSNCCLCAAWRIGVDSILSLIRVRIWLSPLPLREPCATVLCLQNRKNQRLLNLQSLTGALRNF